MTPGPEFMSELGNLECKRLSSGYLYYGMLNLQTSKKTHWQHLTKL